MAGEIAVLVDVMYTYPLNWYDVYNNTFEWMDASEKQPDPLVAYYTVGTDVHSDYDGEVYPNQSVKIQTFDLVQPSQPIKIKAGNYYLSTSGVKNHKGYIRMSHVLEFRVDTFPFSAVADHTKNLVVDFTISGYLSYVDPDEQLVLEWDFGQSAVRVICLYINTSRRLTQQPYSFVMSGLLYLTRKVIEKQIKGLVTVRVTHNSNANVFPTVLGYHITLRLPFAQALFEAKSPGSADAASQGSLDYADGDAYPSESQGDQAAGWEIV